MTYSMENICKISTFVIILLLIINNQFSYSAENRGRTASGNRSQASSQREPLIIELEDPLEIEQSQLIFPDSAYQALKIKKEEYRESPLRRGEIVFFIAFPFLYAYNLMIVQAMFKSTAAYSSGRSLNSYHYLFMLISTAVVSGFIAYDDNRFVFGTPLDRERLKKRPEVRIDLELFHYRF